MTVTEIEGMVLDAGAVHEADRRIALTGTPVEKLAYSFNARGVLSADEQHNYVCARHGYGYGPG